jgi:hypothetical protein
LRLVRYSLLAVGLNGLGGFIVAASTGLPGSGNLGVDAALVFLTPWMLALGMGYVVRRLRRLRETPRAQEVSVPRALLAITLSTWSMVLLAGLSPGASVLNAALIAAAIALCIFPIRECFRILR